MAFNRSLILAEDFRAAEGQLAVFEIQHEVDFPGLKGIASSLSANKLTDQAPEAIELELAVLKIVFRGHDQ